MSLQSRQALGKQAKSASSTMQHHNDSVPASTRGSYDASDRPTKRRKGGTGMEALLAREVGLMREGGSSTSFVGSASGIHFIRSVYGAIGSPTANSTSPATNLVPGEEDRLNHAGHTQGLQKPIWRSDEVAAPPTSYDFNDLLRWTSSYFDNWHPALPFLHAPQILKFMQDLATGDLAALSERMSPEIVMLKSIISLSLLDRRQSDRHSPAIKKVPKSLVFNSFDEAVESVSFALTKTPTIVALQAVLCVQIFLVSMLRLNVAARLEGLMTQMAYQLGLHRCPMRYQTFSAEDRLLRKRLFWSMYCVERWICQALGLPLTIRDEDVDVCHLNKEQHPSFSQRRLQSPVNAEQGSNIDEQDDRLQLLCFLAEHAQLRGSIIELRNKRVEERDKRTDSATLINASLTQWWNQVEDFLEQAEDEAEPTVSKMHQGVLQVLRHESIIMLYRPLLALPKDNANYAGAVHSCIGAAKSLLSTLSALLVDSSATGQRQYSSVLMWPTFTWASWQSAFILLYGAAEGVVSTKVASRNVDKALRILHNLALRGNIWPDACAVAIRDLRSVLAQKTDSLHGTNDTSHTNRGASYSETPVTSPLVSLQGISSQQSHNNATGHYTRQSPQNQNARPELVSQHPLDRTTSIQTPTQLSRPASVPTIPQTHLSITPTVSQHQYPSSTKPMASVDEGHLLTDFGDEEWMSAGLLSKDMPPFHLTGLDPFQGFDIPFWVGQDNYSAWIGENG